MQSREFKLSLLWAVVATSMISMLFYNVIPLYVGSLQDSLGFSHQELGLIVGAFFLGFNITSTSAYFWVRKASPRYISIAIVILTIALLLLSTLLNSFSSQMINIVFIGGASGALSAITATILGDVKNASRWFGIKVSMEALMGAILLLVLPVTLIPNFGFTGMVYGMAAIILLLSPAVFFLMRQRLPKVEGSAVSTADKVISYDVAASSKWSVWLALLGFLFFSSGTAAIWTFVERLAVNNGFEPASIGLLLSVALFFAVIGSAITGWVGNRFGDFQPYFADALLVIAGVIALAATSNFAAFMVGACVYMMGWAGGTGYSYAIVAKADPNGRHIALAMPAQGIGFMFGPAIGGYLYSNESALPLLMMTLISVVISIALMWRSAVSSKSDKAVAKPIATRKATG